MATAAELNQLYLAYFGRPADADGSTFYATKTVAQVVAAFSASPESVSLYGATFGIAQVNAIYQNLFNRDAALSEAQAWVNLVNAPNSVVGPAAAALAILQGAKNDDLASVNNKLAISAAFVTAIDTTAEAVGYSGTQAAASARAFVKTVGSTAATLTAAQAQVDAQVAAAVAVGTSSTGSGSASLVLTEGVNNVLGSAANNFIDGSLATTVAGRLQTFNNADQIDGGDGIDTLFAQLTASVTPAGFKNVEILDVEAQAAVVVDLNIGDTKLTTIKSSNSGANLLTVSNVQSAPTNYAVSNSTGGLTVNVVNARLAGTADAAQIDLTNVTGGTITLQTVTAASGYETLTVNSIGSVANVLTGLTDGLGTSLATVKIIGSQAVTLPLLDTSVTTVDASTATGAVTLTVAAANGQNMTITGGSGADVINMNGTYTSDDKIDGGAGSDRLTLTNAEAIAATTTQANVKNIEFIGLSDGLNGTVAVNNFTATGFRFGANQAGNSVINYAAGTNALQFQQFSGGNFTLAANVAGTATNDILNVTMGSATAGNTFGTGAVTISGAETVNLTSQGGANSFGGTFTITDTAATQSLIITGSQSITFTGAVRADVVDASGLTGAATLTLTGGTSTTATTITGTANNDVLNGSTAGDIINGGAGDDQIANVVTGNNATAGDVITGGTGNDTITLRGDLTGSGGVAVATNLPLAAFITDFTVGTTATATDVLALSAAKANYSNASAFYTGIATAAAGSTTIQSVGQNAAAAAVLAGTDLVKLTTGVATTGLTLQAAFNAAIGSGTLTGFTANDDVFVTLYDTTNSRMLILVADTAGGATTTVLETADTVTLVGSVAMSAADYGTFSATNLAIVAA